MPDGIHADKKGFQSIRAQRSWRVAEGRFPTEPKYIREMNYAEKRPGNIKDGSPDTREFCIDKPGPQNIDLKIVNALVCETW